MHVNSGNRSRSNLWATSLHGLLRTATTVGGWNLTKCFYRNYHYHHYRFYNYLIVITFCDTHQSHSVGCRSNRLYFHGCSTRNRQCMSRQQPACHFHPCRRRIAAGRRCRAGCRCLRLEVDTVPGIDGQRPRIAADRLRTRQKVNWHFQLKIT